MPRKVAWTWCRACQSPQRVRRSGLLKIHRLLDGTRCSGSNTSEHVHAAWPNPEDVRAYIAKAQKVQPEMAAVEEETIAPGDVEAAVDKAFEEEFFN
jgi:hypothetical protein